MQNGSGARDVPLDSMAVSLEAWKLHAGRSNLDAVFAKHDRAPFWCPSMLKPEFWPGLKLAILRHVTFHSLGHSFAKAMIMRGAPIIEIQHRLDHKKPTITFDTYSHWFKGIDSPKPARPLP